jgi:hypothetical protein
MHLEIAEIANNSGLGDLWQRLNSGYVELTPSGGLHWLYRVSDGTLPGNTKLAESLAKTAVWMYGPKREAKVALQSRRQVAVPRILAVAVGL